MIANSQAEMVSNEQEEIKLLRSQQYPYLPMLKVQAGEYFLRKPYAGLTILHNMHITDSTVSKILSLACSGARVVITSTENMYSQDKCIKQLVDDYGHEFISPDNLAGFKCDVALDCCASLVDLVKPRLGFVELTQTGCKILSERNLDVPTVSIDSCELKKVETFLGTGEAFIRGIKHLVNDDLIGKKVTLFGCGKVGSGILVNIANIPMIDITVVDGCMDNVKKLQDIGVHAININNKEEWIPGAVESDYIVTATGIKHMLSSYLDAGMIKNKNCILANMGSDDEFGGNFPDSMCLNNKFPINFALPEPTLSRFLDPVFVAHNLAIDSLLANKGSRGVFPLDKKIDDLLIKKWLVTYFGVENMEELFSDILRINPQYYTLFGDEV